MSIPNIKRITIRSVSELSAWLNKQPTDAQSVMLVTHSDKSNDKHVTREQVHDALTSHGWTAGFSYTLKGNLLGHVISKS